MASRLHTIASADEFQRLLADPSTTRSQLVSVVADARVWLEVLERWPHAASWVAANRALPREVVLQLAQHASVQVRAALATGTSLPEEVMMQLAHDRSELIRVRVVCNAGASREVLVELAGDPCQVVSAHAQSRLVHDSSGLAPPTDYIGELRVRDLLH